MTRRRADNGNDLWTTFNVVQENVIRGGLRGVALDGNNHDILIDIERVFAVLDGHSEANFTSALYAIDADRRGCWNPRQSEIETDLYLKRKNTRWVKPTLIAEIEYRAWTENGMLRHASYKGLREEQDNAEVYRIQS